MTTQEHLQRIRAKCVERILEHEAYSITHGYKVGQDACAGWRATIAAIDSISTMEGGAAKHFLERDILAAWPEELL